MTVLGGGSGSSQTPSTPDTPDTSNTPSTPSTPTVPNQTVSFADVPKTHWAYEYVAACVEKGIVSGMDDNEFAPDNQLTNAQYPHHL